ncbi:hypothetical protein EVAR_35205_1 [Eumeta japonica]|uniref:Uncharacterized protein n=1 Tax=Eumeta variegata TaxID=151549 RepID=A0A4C1VCP2_EUMVA|nr:hypothetical protein EVAR_35205_1 [Eumeta japonica]
MRSPRSATLFVSHRVILATLSSTGRATPRHQAPHETIECNLCLPTPEDGHAAPVTPSVARASALSRPARLRGRHPSGGPPARPPAARRVRRAPVVGTSPYIVTNANHKTSVVTFFNSCVWFVYCSSKAVPDLGEGDRSYSLGGPHKRRAPRWTTEKKIIQTIKRFGAEGPPLLCGQQGLRGEAFRPLNPALVRR